ncbi:MAG: hypothetical protein HY591_00575, partial [Candidatus Omnitrophica bacterium]|nr:hypothetical protein [Candidatus Omnitrophota bacterium]
SQQTRFLLPPLCLMTVLAIAFMPRLSKIFLCLVVISLGLETISLVRAHRDDWGKSSMEVIRDKDKQLLALAQQGEKVPVELDFPDVAFAPFIVDVRTSGSVYVMPHWLRKINTTKP